MALMNDSEIKVSLTCAHQLKGNVCRTAEEFKHLRRRLLQSLQLATSAQGQNSSLCSSQSSDEEETRDDRFQEVSDDTIDQHAMPNRPSLVVFGQNSSGKTSFIQRFVGINNILPADFARTTARIVQLTYASAEQACFRVYTTIEKTSIQYEDRLAQFFENPEEPDWDGIANALLPHVKRPDEMQDNSPEFYAWAKHFVEISLPSYVLSLGIDVYDTPGFLSDNREKVLTENLHNLVQRIRPTLLFLYANATIEDTDKNCFLAMKGALGSLERVPVFFLNTKADCTSIANDYGLDDDPDDVSLDTFKQILHEKREYCYGLLRKRREMAYEILGSLPETIDKCTFFDISTIPFGFDPWETYTNLINSGTFQRIVQFAVKSYSAPTLTLAHDILATVDDYFDLVASTTSPGPRQWNALRQEAIDWGTKFFNEYEKILPNLTDQLIENILQLFQELQPQIVHQATLNRRTNDPIDTLLQDSAKTIRDYIRLAVQEQIIKVAANEVIITRRDEIKALISHHFEQSRRVRKNELLAMAQRQVLGEITGQTLQQTTLFNTFLDNLIKIPMRCSRFLLSLPTRLSNNRRKLNNQYIQSNIEDDDIYNLLDAMDTYNALSNEEGRRQLATRCLTELATEIKERKMRFSENLVAWVRQQRMEFNKRIQSDYEYLSKYLSDQQLLHGLVSRFSVSFSMIECQLLAAIELDKRKGAIPVIGQELGRGGFYNVHEARWGTDTKLVIKKLRALSNEHLNMAALEAHYHRVATLAYVDHIAPLLSIYENQISNFQREYWFIMPRYPRSLRQYLQREMHAMSLIHAVDFGLNIASTIADLHRLEIIHRDIKASNVMLDYREQCYLIDFTTTKFGAVSKTVMGTCPLPPEIARIYYDDSSETVQYDGTAADIYSFGILLYEMLPKPAYEQPDKHILSRFEEIRRSIPRSNINLKEYTDLIHACLNQEPKNRPTALDLLSRLRSLRQTIEAKLCITCRKREFQVRCLPCEHKATCAQCWTQWLNCSNGIARCVICYTEVENITHENI